MIGEWVGYNKHGFFYSFKYGFNHIIVHGFNTLYSKTNSKKNSKIGCILDISNVMFGILCNFTFLKTQRHN